jgi:hypothetical protein
MTFKKKMLDSKIFITSFTEMGIVTREEIRVGNFSVTPTQYMGYLATFQLYWWRKTSGSLPCIFHL